MIWLVGGLVVWWFVGLLVDCLFAAFVQRGLFPLADICVLKILKV